MSGLPRRPAMVSRSFYTIRPAAGLRATRSLPRRLSVMTRKALGRGLSALIREPEAPPAIAASEPDSTVAVELIDANPFQPRTSFDEAELSELSQSVKINGIIQPVLLRPAGDRYQLVAGE